MLASEDAELFAFATETAGGWGAQDPLPAVDGAAPDYIEMAMAYASMAEVALQRAGEQVVK